MLLSRLMLIGLGWAGRVRAGEGQWCIMVYGAAEACFFLCVCVFWFKLLMNASAIVKNKTKKPPKFLIKFE